MVGIYRPVDTIIVDGRADERTCKNVVWSDSFVDIEAHNRVTPRFNTQVEMLWDEEYLYIYAELEEPHVWGDLTERG